MKNLTVRHYLAQMPKAIQLPQTLLFPQG